MIIGLTGYLCSGKDTIADFLQSKGFKHISLSDILREELKSQNKKVTRKNLQELGNKLRERFGPGALAERALLMTDSKQDYVISSIGTVGEIDVLKKNPHFHLVFVDADQKTRWKRMKNRKREQDPTSFKEFKEHETLESKGGDSNYRAFDETKKLADIIFINEGSLKTVYKKAEKMYLDIKNKRPSWDEYFLGIMDAVGQRGTCDRGRTGCVIVKNNRILTTGYVGSPIGLDHCDEVGHLFHEVTHKDGSVSKHCIRTAHAEQNAIVQAARHGIAIDGATIYVKMEPCFVCAKMIINAGIKRVVTRVKYHGAKYTKEFLESAGVKLIILNDEFEMYADMGSHMNKEKENK